MSPDEPFVLVAAVVVGVLSLTRAVRLVVDDDYPPIVAARAWYVRHIPEAWGPLVECPWCAAPYLAAPAAIWFASLIAFPTNSVNNWAWWIVNGWAAAAWVAAWLTVRDLPSDQR